MNLILTAADTALRTLFAKPHAAQACPTLPDRQTELSDSEKAHAAALMRVNHVGEVCAQALYTAQALATSNPALRAHFTQACNEETSHLAWTEQRLQELGSHKSLLNPLWYAGAFGLGLIAGKLGDPISLGFVVETEKQVGAHLQSHLAFGKHGLPEGDHASRAIVFGSPTYMGSVSWQFKKFADASSKRWFTRAWQDKFFAGFSVSASLNGDKGTTLSYLTVLAAQTAVCG